MPRAVSPRPLGLTASAATGAHGVHRGTGRRRNGDRRRRRGLARRRARLHARDGRALDHDLRRLDHGSVDRARERVALRPGGLRRLEGDHDRVVLDRREVRHAQDVRACRVGHHDLLRQSSGLARTHPRAARPCPRRRCRWCPGRARCPSRSAGVPQVTLKSAIALSPSAGTVNGWSLNAPTGVSRDRPAAVCGGLGAPGLGRALGHDRARRRVHVPAERARGADVEHGLQMVVDLLGGLERRRS